MRKRKFLNDVVNTLPRMIMAERMSYADLETLANLPDGGLSIDLLNRRAVHSAGHGVLLQIVPHLAGWLSRRRHSSDARFEDLAHARLRLVFRTRIIPTDRTQLLLFDGACACTIAPHDSEERSGQAGGRAWYDRYQHGPDRDYRDLSVTPATPDRLRRAPANSDAPRRPRQSRARN